MNLYFSLDAHGEPYPVETDTEEDWIAWARAFERAHQRQVGDDKVAWSRVSTIFLGINHNFTAGPPVLWETMVFGGPLDREQWRCSGSRKQAEAMHQRALVLTRASYRPRPFLAYVARQIIFGIGWCLSAIDKRLKPPIVL